MQIKREFRFVQPIPVLRLVNKVVFVVIEGQDFDSYAFIFPLRAYE